MYQRKLVCVLTSEIDCSFPDGTKLQDSEATWVILRTLEFCSKHRILQVCDLGKSTDLRHSALAESHILQYISLRKRPQ